MNIFEILLISIGLSMDAFAVAVCKGLSPIKPGLKPPLLIGLYFGFFQALMPVIGFFAGIKFMDLIKDFDHWIAFGLLLIIGIKMLREASDHQVCPNSNLGPKTMFPLALATSVDALAVGISFAILDVNIVPAASIIGITTFFLSAIGVYVGRFFGSKYKSKAEVLGGIVLIVIGVKILVSHLISG